MTSSFEISPRLRRAIDNPSPNINEFVSVITGRQMPQRVHLVELFADQPIMANITEKILGKTWINQSAQRDLQKQHLLCQIQYWYRMGYDYIRVSGGLSFAGNKAEADDTAELSRGKRGWAKSSSDILRSTQDLQRYPWPKVRDEDLWMYEFVSRHLPEGMGIMACPASGLFEIASGIGYETLCYLICDQPELVSALIRRIGDIQIDAYRRLVQIPGIVGFFQGDDMGYKTATMVSPQFLRDEILPWHKKVAQLAHDNGKIYLLHSCGQLESITDDLIDDVKIDAKHSYEDEITPVEDFARTYGRRVGVLGGVPVDLLARAKVEQLRRRVRHILQTCMPLGRYALGSGNSVANYVKPENFLAMLDEGLAFSESH